KQFFKNLNGLLHLNEARGFPMRIVLAMRGPRTRKELLRHSPIVRELASHLKFGLHDLQPANHFDDWSGLIKPGDLLVGMRLRKAMPKPQPCFMLGALAFTWDGRQVGCACRDLNVDSDLDFGKPTAEGVARYVTPQSPLVQLRVRWREGKLPAPCVDCKQYQPDSAFTHVE
ncbi:MAG: hypothetical protein JST92_21120, partial [Deltaproteobacteria bacterium]|nr:hypothetical protein [Deltaproteobacteria bacterium]